MRAPRLRSFDARAGGLLEQIMGELIHRRIIKYNGGLEIHPQRFVQAIHYPGPPDGIDAKFRELDVRLDLFRGKPDGFRDNVRQDAGKFRFRCPFGARERGSAIGGFPGRFRPRRPRTQCVEDARAALYEPNLRVGALQRGIEGGKPFLRADRFKPHPGDLPLHGWLREHPRVPVAPVDGPYGKGEHCRGMAGQCVLEGASRSIDRMPRLAYKRLERGEKCQEIQFFAPERPQQGEAAPRLGAKDAVYLSGVQVPEKAAFKGHGRLDDAMQPPEPLLRLTQGAPDFLRIGDVGPDVEDFAALCAHFLHCRTLCAVRFAPPDQRQSGVEFPGEAQSQLESYRARPSDDAVDAPFSEPRSMRLQPHWLERPDEARAAPHGHEALPGPGFGGDGGGGFRRASSGWIAINVHAGDGCLRKLSGKRHREAVQHGRAGMDGARIVRRGGVLRHHPQVRPIGLSAIMHGRDEPVQVMDAPRSRP